MQATARRLSRQLRRRKLEHCRNKPMAQMFPLGVCMFLFAAIAITSNADADGENKEITEKLRTCLVDDAKKVGDGPVEFACTGKVMGECQDSERLQVCYYLVQVSWAVLTEEYITKANKQCVNKERGCVVSEDDREEWRRAVDSLCRDVRSAYEQVYLGRIAADECYLQLYAKRAMFLRAIPQSLER